MTRSIDGALALVYAQWAQKKIAEGEMADQAEKLEAVNDAQTKLRELRSKLNEFTNDDMGNLSAGEIAELSKLAEEVGLDVAGSLDAMWKGTAAGQMTTNDGSATYETADDFLAANYQQQANGTYSNTVLAGSQDAQKNAHVAIDKENDRNGMYRHVEAIRQALTDQLDSLKSEASGQELELQMASQEYSRSTQLASNLLNTRNESLKAIVSALSRA